MTKLILTVLLVGGVLSAVAVVLPIGKAAADLPGVPAAYQIDDLGQIPSGPVDTAPQLFISRASDLVVDPDSGQEWNFSSGAPVLTTYPVPSYVDAVAMNNSGTVVEDATGGSGTWSDGTFTPAAASNLTLPIWNGATYSVTDMTVVLGGINDGGTAVGEAYATCLPSYSIFASSCNLAVEEPGPAVVGAIPSNGEGDLDCEYDDFYATDLSAISNDGTAYGSACWSLSNPVSVTGSGSPEPLANWPATTDAIQQSDVNSSGEIATDGDLWANGVNIPMLGSDGNPISPAAMNDSEVVVGTDGSQTAEIWTQSGSTTLQALSGGALNSTGTALGIDSAGDIVGTETVNGRPHAFLAVPAAQLPTLSIGTPAPVSKPASGTSTLTFPVTLSSPSNDTVTVDYSAENVSAVNGTDYTLPAGTLTFPPRVTSEDITATIEGGAADSSTRTFTVTLTNPTNATIATAMATGTIEGPTLSVDNVTVDRSGDGNHSANFTVTLSQPTKAPVTFSYATADQTARAGTDYTAEMGTGTIKPDKTSTVISIPVQSNPAGGGLSSTFLLNISNPSPSSVTVGTPTGIATLQEGLLTVASDKTTVWGNGHDTATLTVTATGANGSPATGQKVTISTLSPGAIISPLVKGQTKTDGAGQVQFTVASDEPVPSGVTPSPTTFRASIQTKQLSASSTVDVTFDRHKIVVQFLGIRTDLDCAGASSTCTSPSDSDVFLGLRAGAVGGQGFQESDFLWYSYKGGRVDPSTGEWEPKSYSCSNTGQDYGTDIARLNQLVEDYGTANTNTDFYIVGHSQGGLLALQELGFLQQVPPSDTMQAVMTLDSPLGGVPLIGTSIPGLFTCWRGPAFTELSDLALTAGPSGSPDQGSASETLCAFISSCQDETNAQMVTNAVDSGTTVDTFGSTTDALYTPSACLLPAVYAVPTTQVVNTASISSLSALGGNQGPSPLTCLLSSHTQVVTTEQSAMLSTIGTQDP